MFGIFLINSVVLGYFSEKQLLFLLSIFKFIEMHVMGLLPMILFKWPQNGCSVKAVKVERNLQYLLYGTSKVYGHYSQLDIHYGLKINILWSPERVTWL